MNLLHFNFSAGFNQLLLGFFGFFLGNGFPEGGGGGGPPPAAEDGQDVRRRGRDDALRAALLSALSLGILYPADDFSPEIACTNAEALMFAFQAMGFRHEAETAAWGLPPEGKKLPDYISATWRWPSRSNRRRRGACLPNRGTASPRRS